MNTASKGTALITGASSGIGALYAERLARIQRRREQWNRLQAVALAAARRALTRHMKRAGRVWIRVFPDKPVTKKPLEVRMGKGKGGVEYWVAQIQPGKVLYEIEGVPEELAREAFALAAAKLPLATSFVKRTVM